MAWGGADMGREHSKSTMEGGKEGTAFLACRAWQPCSSGGESETAGDGICRLHRWRITARSFRFLLGTLRHG